jgi:AraC-like DNA-binding protein
MATTAAATRTAATARYERKKQAIIAAASDILNHHGVKGMTLAGVASRVGLITTSVTYYFKKMEDLAVCSKCGWTCDVASRPAQHRRLQCSTTFARWRSRSVESC